MSQLTLLRKQAEISNNDAQRKSERAAASASHPHESAPSSTKPVSTSIGTRWSKKLNPNPTFPNETNFAAPAFLINRPNQQTPGETRVTNDLIKQKPHHSVVLVNNTEPQ